MIKIDFNVLVITIMTPIQCIQHTCYDYTMYASQKDVAGFRRLVFFDVCKIFRISRSVAAMQRAELNIIQKVRFGKRLAVVVVYQYSPHFEYRRLGPPTLIQLVYYF